MDHESELPGRLRAAADAVHVPPDLAEVEDGVRRRLARRRLVTGVVALMLVAGAGGLGFGIGRSATDNSGERLTAPAASDSESGVTTVGPETRDAPSDIADDSSGQGDASTPATTVPVPPGAVTGDEGMDSALEYPEFTLVVERVTSTGVTVRGLLGPDYGHENWTEDSAGGPTGWQPEPWCYGGTEFRVGLAAPGLIDVAYLSISQSPRAPVAAWVTQAGWADAHPHLVVVVRAPGANEASVAYPDGATDRSPLTDGLAVLVVPWRADVVDFELSVTGPDGVAVYSAQDLDPNNDPAWREACVPPPPSLPDAGAPPADPAAAEAEVRANFALLYDRAVPLEDKPDHLVDDWKGVVEAQQQVSEGPNAEVAETAEFIIEEFVFTSPDEAWFRYRIETSLSSFSERFGVARFIDGHWRIVRATVCQDLSLGGGGCEEGVSFRVFPGLTSFQEQYDEMFEGDVTAATMAPAESD